MCYGVVKLLGYKDVIHRPSGHIMLSLRNNRSWKIYLNGGDCSVRIRCRERELFLMDNRDWCRED
jgi:hypothetical protein